MLLVSRQFESGYCRNFLLEVEMIYTFEVLGKVMNDRQ